MLYRVGAYIIHTIDISCIIHIIIHNALAYIANRMVGLYLKALSIVVCLLNVFAWVLVSAWMWLLPLLATVLNTPCWRCSCWADCIQHSSLTRCQLLVVNCCCTHGLKLILTACIQQWQRFCSIDVPLHETPPPVANVLLPPTVLKYISTWQLSDLLSGHSLPVYCACQDCLYRCTALV